ncbi:MAG: hypothetical protein IJF20_01810 [Clostridia bacterium]|nr:hypothetical protein [Oscillospiraceae bacterium]MBQ2827955.1 hypothetical protein [Clostridia bacterium]
MKITKKILCVLLALSFVFASVSVSMTASAASDMAFTISNVKKASGGDTVTMKVTLSNSKPVCVVNPTVEYDAEKLEFVSATNGDVFPSGAFMIGDAHEGKVRILYYNGTENVQKNGTVCTLKFKVLKGATGYADVKLDFPENSVVNAKEQAVKFTNKAGRVSIVSPVIYVDANENKKVDAGEEIEDKYYQKVPLFASYRDQSVQLSTSIVGDTIKSVEWSIDSDRLTIDEDGVVRPNRWWYCRANVTAKITSKSGEVLEKTVMVEFFKLAITKRLPVF